MNSEIKWAMAVAQAEKYERKDWLKAESILINAGLCPHCACDGKRSKLGPRIPGDRENYPYRECFECGETAVRESDRQAEFEGEDYGGVLACNGMVYSDADSGL